MPSRRIILLFIAVLAMLGAGSAQGQSGARARNASASASTTRTPAVRSPIPFPYKREPDRLSRADFLGKPGTRRISPRLVVPAGDKIQGSAGLVWTPRSMFGTVEIRLLLF